VLVQFGEPISLKAAAARAGLPQRLDAADEIPWRDATTRLGYRILREVATITSATPTAAVAAALLSHRGRGLSESSLVERCDTILEFLDGACARLSEAVVGGWWAGADRGPPRSVPEKVGEMAGG